MKIWLITIGEPVPINEVKNDRLHRTGQLATFLSNSGIETTWWTSTFDHWRKFHHFASEKEIILNTNLKIILLNGGGYKSNLSLKRFRDHYKIAKKFFKLSAQIERPDLIIVAYPALELCSKAIKFGKIYSIPVIVDLRDMWPDIFVEVFPSSLQFIIKMVLTPYSLYSKRILKNATSIIGITKEFVKWGLTNGNRQATTWDRSFPFSYASTIPSDDQLVLANEFWDKKLTPELKYDLILICIGTISRTIDFDTLVKTSQEIAKLGSKIKIFVCGDGEKLEYYKNITMGSNTIEFVGWLDKAKLFIGMQRAQIGIDPMPYRKDFLATINNKAIEYLSSGLPIISSPDEGVLKEFLSTNKCGFSYATGNVQQLLKIIQTIISNKEILKEMSLNSKRIFESFFSNEKVLNDYLVYFKEIHENHNKNIVPNLKND